MNRKVLIVGGAAGALALLLAAAASASSTPSGNGRDLIGAYAYPPLGAFTGTDGGRKWLRAIEEALGPNTGLVGLIVRVTEASADGNAVSGMLEQVDVYGPGGKGVVRRPAPAKILAITPMFDVASLGAPV